MKEMKSNRKTYITAIMTVVILASAVITTDLKRKSDLYSSMAYAQEQSHSFALTELSTRHSYNNREQGKVKEDTNIQEQHEARVQKLTKIQQITKQQATAGSVNKQSDTKPVEYKQEVGGKLALQQTAPVVSVFVSSEQLIERVPMEKYVLGVALAELPGSFEYEAIKAQMLAVRTYITRRLKITSESNETPSYNVTDTTTDQVYLAIDKVKDYEQNYPEQYDKFVRALQETEGMIITYNNEPIDALFFSTSNGNTENAEEVWGQEVDYLKSVPSPWDEELSPNAISKVSYSFDELYRLLNLKESRRNGKVKISNVTYTDSDRVDALQINGASFTGKGLREKLNLSSTDISWTIDQRDKSITFTCKGYGHGVGMSQWGANGMARQGYTAEEIVKHYYKGVHIEQTSL